MVVEELDEPERDRDRELGAPTLPGSTRHGPVGGVVAPQASLVEPEATQADAAGGGGPSLRARHARAAPHEDEQPPAPQREAPGSPPGWGPGRREQRSGNT